MKHYTISYENNTDSGTAVVMITGKGDYAGTASKTFTISKATITITPKAGQSKTLGTNDPVLTFDATGAKGNEAVGTSGSLSRTKGEDAGTYVITQGTLALADHGAFKASNYELKFSETPVLFTINASTAKTNPDTYTHPSNGLILAVIACLAIIVGGIMFFVRRPEGFRQMKK